VENPTVGPIVGSANSLKNANNENAHNKCEYIIQKNKDVNLF
jgi:hypothetical protein